MFGEDVDFKVDAGGSGSGSGRVAEADSSRIECRVSSVECRGAVLAKVPWADKTRRTDQANKPCTRLQIPTGTRDETRWPTYVSMGGWRESHAP